MVLGALNAVREAGKIRPDQFFGGIDGEFEAVAEIKKGGPYKISISLASTVFGYAMGQHAADWLEGKSIPQAMDILPSALTAGNIVQHEVDLANPAAVFNVPSAGMLICECMGIFATTPATNMSAFPGHRKRIKPLRGIEWVILA